MEKKIKELTLTELTSEELLEYNAGTERKDAMQTEFWEVIFKYLRP